MHTRTSAPLFGLALATLVSPTAQALEQNAVIVTATRTAQTVDETLASVTVITRQDIDNSQARDVIELLRLQAGIDVARYGGPGTGTSVFLRGTNSTHTLVLIDGVRAASATTGSFAWQHLNPANIERIEIVRGPRAAQYGSDAIGGVIQIFTRQNRKLHVRGQLGSYDSRSLDAGFGGGKKISYSLNASYRDTEGFSATNPGNTFSYDPDDDGYRERSINGKLAIPLGDRTQLTASGWLSSSQGEYDQGLNDNSNATFDARLAHHSSPAWTQTFSLGLARDDSKDTSSNSSRIRTERLMADWQHDITLNASQLLTLGLGSYRDDASNVDLVGNSTVFDESISNNAVFAILQSNLGKHDLNLSARLDDHESFGSHGTGQLAWGYNSSKDLRWLASWGTAFRAPTLNELYHPGFFGFYAGNPNLEPEESATVEAGFRYTLSTRQKLRLTGYHTTIDELIAYQGTNSQAINIARARIDGLELEHDYTDRSWSVLTRYTLQKAIDDNSKIDLSLRPRRKLSLQVQRRLASGTTLGGEWIYASQRLNGSTVLPAYNLINLSARVRMGKAMWFEGRVENLFDEDYELRSGYNTSGRAFYLGLNYAPDE